MKSVDNSLRTKNLKLTERRKCLEEYSFTDDKDFIELNLAHEFEDPYHTGIEQPRATGRKKTTQSINEDNNSDDGIPEDAFIRRTHLFEDTEIQSTASGDD